VKILYTHFPKEVTGILAQSNRKLACITLEAKLLPKPGILARIASIVADMNMRILSLSFTSRNDRRYITMFVDLTESKHSIEELVGKIKPQEFTVRIEYATPEIPGLLIDRHSFPLESMGGRVRALLIPVDVFSGIFAEFKRRYGSAGWALAFHQGKLLGEFVAKQLKELTQASPIALSKALAWLYSAYGWGRMRIEYVSRIRREAGVIVEDNFEVEGYGKSEEPVCHFTRGILEGGANVIWKGKFVVREAYCKAQGREHCKFVIREHR